LRRPDRITAVQHTGEAEILVLRHQLNVLKRQAPKRILDLAIPSGLLAIADEVIE
jgi:hypothetical protein